MSSHSDPGRPGRKELPIPLIAVAAEFTVADVADSEGCLSPRSYTSFLPDSAVHESAITSGMSAASGMAAACGLAEIADTESRVTRLDCDVGIRSVVADAKSRP